jgi:hypothetical protein
VNILAHTPNNEAITHKRMNTMVIEEVTAGSGSDTTNPLDGVNWVPLRQEFNVLVPDGWRKRLVGYFPTLEKATAARRAEFETRKREGTD